MSGSNFSDKTQQKYIRALESRIKEYNQIEMEELKAYVQALEKKVVELESFKSAITRADELADNIKWDEPDTRIEYDKVVESKGFQKALDKMEALNIETADPDKYLVIKRKKFNKLRFFFQEAKSNTR